MDIGKKGELTTSELIGVVILIVSVAIIIFVYFQINWTGQIDDSVCHESVILRGTLSKLGALQNIAPLKCDTEKFCIRGEKLWWGKGNCYEEYANAKDVKKVDVNTVNDIDRFISQEMLSCWQMMGEGKISLFNKKFMQAGIDSSCVICSRFAFDEITLDQKNINLEQINIEEYMRSHKAPNMNISYYDYFAGDNGKVAVNENTVQPSNETGLTTAKDSELAIVFMQVSAPSTDSIWTSTLKKLEIGAAGGSFLVGAPALFSIAAGAISTIGAVPTLLIVGGSQAVVQVQGWANRNVAAGYCGDVSFGDDARLGCSVVRVVNFDDQGISQFCGRIESTS